jgi:hypothetical protein
MRKQQTYQDFQDAVFQEISDLQSQRNRTILLQLIESYGLTVDEAHAAFKPGMNGRAFNEAIWAIRKKTPPTPSTQV